MPAALNLCAAFAKIGAARSGSGLQKSLKPLPFLTSFVASARSSSASARALADTAGGMLVGAARVGRLWGVGDGAPDPAPNRAARSR